LALPGFTYGLDIVVLVGQLHLGKHQTVDEVHQEVPGRLRALGVSISRREILSLFDAYCTLLKAASEAKQDLDFLAQVKENGGIIVSVDGIQPDRGKETIYLVRDTLDVPRSGSRERHLFRDRSDESLTGSCGGLRSGSLGNDY
jgi:hypothetical protein